MTKELIQAIQAQNLKEVRKYLAQGTTPELLETCIITAAEIGSLNLLKLLVEDYGANVNVSTKGDGCTPLHAIFFDTTATPKDDSSLVFSIVKYLIDRGAKVNVCGGWCRTPLTQAISYCHSQAKTNQKYDFSILDLLFDHAVDVNFEQTSDEIDWNEGANTALGDAVFLNDVTIVKYLIDKGANPNPEDAELSPLEIAVYNYSDGKLEAKEVVDILKNIGAKITSNILIKEIEGALLWIWYERERFYNLQSKEIKLLDGIFSVCLQLDNEFPEYFDQGEYMFSHYSLAALSFVKDRITASRYLSEKMVNNISEMSLEFKATTFCKIFNFDHGIDCPIESNFLGKLLQEERTKQFFALKDKSLKESFYFEQHKTKINQLVVNMKFLNNLNETEHEEQIKNFMTEMFQLYINFFQHCPAPVDVTEFLTGDNQKILFDTIKQIQTYYVDYNLAKFEKYDEVIADVIWNFDANAASNFTNSNWVWEDISLVRSQIEAFNYIFGKLNKLDQMKLIEFMVDCPWICEVDEKYIPKNVPKTHWWWFV